VQAAVAVLTVNSSPSSKTTYAVPRWSTAIENGFGGVTGGVDVTIDEVAP
jgi:hypothetical protein